MSPAVDLAYADPEVPSGAVVSVVEIVGADLTTVARSVVRADVPVRVPLPAGGRYVAHGLLPGGDRLAATFTVEPDDRPVVAVLNRRPVAPGDRAGAGPPGEGWLLSWRQEAGTWHPVAPSRPRPAGRSGLVLPTAGGARPYEPLAVQVGADGAAPRITLVPAGTALRLARSATELLPGLGATLLGYVHRGDSASARVAVEAALAEYPRPGRPGNGLLDLAVGYFLVNSFHDQAPSWVEQLRDIQPESADVAVLGAWLGVQGRRPGADVGEAFAYAASAGLPVVADGLRMLVDGLSLLAGAPQPADPEPARRLRHYLTECLPSPVTTFVGADPMSPGVVPESPGAPSAHAIRLSAEAVRTAAASSAADDLTTSDRALVERCQAGEAGAFAALADRYLDTVYRFAYFRVGNTQLAEDLTADTFWRARRRIGDLTPPGPAVGAWLVAIVRGLVADHFKSGRYRLEVTTGDVLGTGREDHGREVSPEPAVADHLTDGALLTAVKHLGPEQQECIVLRFLQGFSVAETAQATGRSEGAVKALQYRAVRALARMLPKGLLEQPVRSFDPFGGRRVEQFALLLGDAGADRGRLDPDRVRYDLGGLVAVAGALRAVRPYAPVDGEFRSGLRAALLSDALPADAAVADAAVAVHPAGRREPVFGRRIRTRGAIVISVAAGALAVSGISAASDDATPGDALYGVKRSAERAQLALAGSDLARGGLSLDFARTRLAEAIALDAGDSHLDDLLNDMNGDTRLGVRLLTGSAVDHRDAAPLTAVDRFVADQRRDLAALGDPGAEVDAAGQVLDEVERRSAALRRLIGCDASAFGPPDRYGPVPLKSRC